MPAGTGGSLGVCKPPPSHSATCGVEEFGLSLELVVAGPVLHAQRMMAALNARKAAAAAPLRRGTGEPVAVAVAVAVNGQRSTVNGQR